MCPAVLAERASPVIQLLEGYMVAKLVVAVSFIVLALTVVDASAFSSGSKKRTESFSASTSTNNVVKAVEPTSVYALASGVLLLGGAAWLVRRK